MRPGDQAPVTQVSCGGGQGGVDRHASHNRSAPNIPNQIQKGGGARTPISKMGMTVASSLPVLPASPLQCRSLPSWLRDHPSPCLLYGTSCPDAMMLPLSTTESRRSGSSSHWTIATPSQRSALGHGGSQKYTEGGRL